MGAMATATIGADRVQLMGAAIETAVTTRDNLERAGTPDQTIRATAAILREAILALPSPDGAEQAESEEATADDPADSGSERGGASYNTLVETLTYAHQPLANRLSLKVSSSKRNSESKTHEHRERVQIGGFSCVKGIGRRNQWQKTPGLPLSEIT